MHHRIPEPRGFGGVQGFEGNVLEGGRNVLLHRKIPHILTEVGPAMLRAANSDATAYLQQFVEARRRRCDIEICCCI